MVFLMVVVLAEESREESTFVPNEFVAPKLSSVPLFFDYFAKTDKIGKRWIPSTAKKDGVEADIAKYDGKWEIGPSSQVSIEGDFGLIVRSKARHHAIAAKLDKPFSFTQKPLVVQYEVRYEEGLECGGGYLKLLSEGAEKNLAGFQDKTPYTIMFGPDKCGITGRVHLIFRYKNPKNGSVDEYHAEQPSGIGSTYWDDRQTHLYTLVLEPTGEFTVSVDQKQLMHGNTLDNLRPSLRPPKEIPDPTDKKPADWDDRAEIEDENAVKPDDWDESQPREVVDENAVKPSDWLENEPELVPDPEATKPADWDNEMDGDWEPPMIDNPACKGISGCGTWKKPLIPNPLYKGKWVRPRISNPAYRGVWSPRLIENPSYFEPKPFEGLAPITAVGIEMWTMSSNIIFDNVLICESNDLANEVARQTYNVRRDEDARLAASQGKGSGIVQGIIDAANDRPWLWVVYVLCILIPIILIGVCCFGRKSNADIVGQRKKTDAPDIDDDVPNLVDDEEDEKDTDESESEETTSAKKEEHDNYQAANDASPSAGDVEENGEGISDTEVVNVVSEEAGDSPMKKSPTMTKRRVRRQD